MSAPGLKLFLSTVTAEFRSYRDLLRADLKGPLLEVKVQEDFIHLGGDTLSLLDDYIAVCGAVIHLIGDATGAPPAPHSVQKLLQRYPDFAARVPMLANLLPTTEFSYTQWEAYLALYHGKTLFLYQPSPEAPKDADFKPDPAQKDSQHQHLLRLQAIDRWAGTFLNHERLSTKVYQSIFNQQWGDRLPGVKSTAVIATPKIRYDHLKAEKLIGRERELARLDRAWADPQTMVVIVRAWGGVGKTALVAAWLSEMAARSWRGAQRVFDWSFYLQGTRPDGEEAKGASADAFFAEALKFFGAPEPHPISPYERGSLLARLVAESKSLLILDGLEPLQHAPGSSQAGQLTDPGMSVLLKALARQNAGLCIVTTREKVTDLTAFYAKTVDEWELSHLTDEAGAELLNTLGVVGTAKERRVASNEVKGHALTLLLMGRYLALAHEGDIRQRDRFEFTEADNETQGGHAFRVLQAYETWLPKSGESGRRQLAILRLLGLFDRPADPGCLAALRQSPAIAGLTDDLVGISDAQWNIAVKRVEEIGLVTLQAYEFTRVLGYSKEQGDEVWANAKQGILWNLPEPEEFRPAFRIPPNSYSLEAHPLLREYFASQLCTDLNSAWRVGHRRLYDHLQVSVPYWPEGMDGLAPLYQAVAHGCQAGLVAQCHANVYQARILRGDEDWGRYSWTKLGLTGAELGAVSCFFIEPWRVLAPDLSPSDQAELLNKAAVYLRALGRLTEALEPMRAAKKATCDLEDWENAAVYCSNLSQLELTLGELTEAVADGDQSVIFADRSMVAFQRMSKRTTYSNALHQAGRREEGLRAFREAENLQAELYCPSRNRSLPSREFAAILSRRNTHDPPTSPLPPGAEGRRPPAPLRR
ncbi:MAG: ATP-binding protein, partial [Planctomycetes bacterium]|nr:ATP-binding protein [Planctomycetota bacterium]